MKKGVKYLVRKVEVWCYRRQEFIVTYGRRMVNSAKYCLSSSEV